jgi:hypothetical protein
MARNNTPAINSLRIASSCRFFAASASDAASVHEGDHDQDNDDADPLSRCSGRVGICFGRSIGVVIGRSIEH